MSTDTEEAAFTAKAAHLLKGPYVGAAMGTFDPGHLAKDILGSVNYGELMAYCYRRFGPPNIGSDPYKDLVYWIITTPMDGLFLGISIRPHDTELLFCYRIDKDLDLKISSVKHERETETRERWQRWCIENKGEEPPLWSAYRDGLRYGMPEYTAREQRQNLYRAEYKTSEEAKAAFATDISLFLQAESALKIAIEDLKRPVFVRDAPISAAGRCDDEDVADDVPYFHAAGYTTDPEFLEDPESWCSLQVAIRSLGRGKIGVQKALELLSESRHDERSLA